MSKVKPVSKSWKFQALILSAISVVILGVAIGLSLLINHIERANYEENRKAKLESAISFCEKYFDFSGAVTAEANQDALTSCQKQLDSVPDAEAETRKYNEQIKSALKFYTWQQEADKYVDENGVVKTSISSKDLNTLSEMTEYLTPTYLLKAAEKLNFLKSEHATMREAESTVNSLFTSAERQEVRKNVVRTEYNDAKAKTDNLKQEELKSRLTQSLDEVLPVIEEQERIARELAEKARREYEERQRKIAASWVNLNVAPYYINQYSAGLPSGCEAAALLMAAKYKGYVRGADFRSFAANMPKSSDPNQGFYLSMDNLEPRNEAHWIAPAPLAAYGAASGIAVSNASGYSLDQLDNEVKNGNPVIIYLTFGFNNPKEYSKGVPRNLHVLVLSGFNSYTGEQKFYDPWPVNGTNPSLSKARTEQLYAASGYRALVVR